MADGLDDVVYIPPVGESQIEARMELASGLAAGGGAVLVQRLPGDEPLTGDVVEIYDVLHTVATNDLAGFDAIPTGAAVLWPLVGGYSDDRAMWEEGVERLAAKRVRCVQGISADLSPADRRRLVDVAGDQGFEKLFHGPAPADREFAAVVHRHGLEPFFPRPLPATPSRVRHNRHLAGILASIGELWLRLGRAESQGQSYFRAARLVDRESHDLVRLAREGNLGVVTWLDEDSGRVVAEITTDDKSTLLTDLRREYLEES